MRALPTIDVAVLVTYLVAMVGMGLWIGRRNRTSDRFMRAGGAIPGWAVGLSIFGTYVSSISFLALPGKAFSRFNEPERQKVRAVLLGLGLVQD